MTFYTLLNTLFFIPMELMPTTPTTTIKTSSLYHWLNGFSKLPCGLYSFHGLFSYFSFLQTLGLDSMMTGLMQPVEPSLGRQEVCCSYTAAQLSLLLFLLFHIFSSLGKTNYK
ncbi:hypothetical protein ACB094_01G374400 [Castanea mollissima]